MWKLLQVCYFPWSFRLIGDLSQLFDIGFCRHDSGTSPILLRRKKNVMLVYCLLLVVQASKLLANLIVVGSGVLVRAFVQAYRQALTSMFFHSIYWKKKICFSASNSALLVFVLVVMDSYKSCESTYVLSEVHFQVYCVVLSPNTLQYFTKSFVWMIPDASKSGVARETAQNIGRVSKFMAEPEARQVLGVTEHSSWEEILKVLLYTSFLVLI